MADFTKAQYAAAIPVCCDYQTLEGHVGMMLCWGLAAALRAGHAMDCTGCDLNTRGHWLERLPPTVNADGVG